MTVGLVIKQIVHEFHYKSLHTLTFKHEGQV